LQQMMILERTTTMAELTGQPGFSPPKKQRTGSRRRQATMIELLAAATLTVSLVIAATAVSMDNKLLTRGDLVEKTTAQSAQARQ
jgi:hypothetical protein